jgi:membrane protein implicated in regulation of membrane protease activity
VADAAVHSYTVAYWVDAGIFAFGAVLTALLFRRRVPADSADATGGPAATSDKPVAAHQ